MFLQVHRTKKKQNNVRANVGLVIGAYTSAIENHTASAGSEFTAGLETATMFRVPRLLNNVL